MRRSFRVFALVFLLGLICVSAVPAAVPGPLDILLINDDGWDSIGIQVLKEALQAAGHTVTVVAPLTNRSGSSASLTLNVVQVQQMSNNEYAVDGTPATCLFLGISAILAERPDLVVSGTNDGKNVGPSAPFSGTVGATIAAIRAGLPAIAMSTEPPVEDETDPRFRAHFVNVADFAVDLIDRLKTFNPTPGVLPEHTALNVNYPPLEPNQVQGVAVRVQGRASSRLLIYEEVAPGVYIPGGGPPPPNEQEVPSADGPAFDAGFITVVPIDGDYTAKVNEWVTIFFLLFGLLP